MADTLVSKVYETDDLGTQERNYDDWAENYERDLMAMGYRIPMVLATVYARLVPADAGPILDVGCGAGLQAEPLSLVGCGPIIGVDLSAGMLEGARRKHIYADLIQTVLGEPLPFENDTFAATIAAGIFTPNHAPPEAFEDLVRVTRPGGLILFSLRDDAGQDPAYPAELARLEAAGIWTPDFVTPSFHSMPWGEPEVTHRIHACRVL